MSLPWKTLCGTMRKPLEIFFLLAVKLETLVALRTYCVVNCRAHPGAHSSHACRQRGPNVIGAVNEMVLVFNGMVPEDTVQELGAVMQVQAVAVAYVQVDEEVAVPDARRIIVGDRGGVVEFVMQRVVVRRRAPPHLCGETLLRAVPGRVSAPRSRDSVSCVGCPGNDF